MDFPPGKVPSALAWGLLRTCRFSHVMKVARCLLSPGKLRRLLAVKLSEQGHFTWTEWAAALAAELKAAEHCGEPDDGTHYYDHWLAALERLATSKGLTEPEALRSRKEAWADAYRHTPHGKPVVLKTSAPPDASGSPETH